ncbi:hypothetical protein Zmor_027018 [Zophobas morio]|uniref:Cationic amino acid transporter C-terminal domain-containing protein n=1 Tax=Zophobas morio TaxID=2755281 RepID=A0AA38HUT0_9CUCU|nr:hypothetical protein Zmor_027018 [Zophobas morio]
MTGEKTQMTKKFFASLTRKKTLDAEETSELARVLSLLDLSALGVGSTLGLGVYVLAGSVAKNISGPAVCISFLVAAVASAVAGLCYAEFAARVPKAGSAYVYSYVSVGEIVAYVIGWNLILEYAIGTASVARGLSGYIDALTDSQIKNGMESWAKMDIDFMASYPDFLAFGFVMLLTGLLSVGVKESSRLNNVFTALNLTTVTIVIVSGAIKSDPANWQLDVSNITDPVIKENAGDGGFMPFGVAGIMAGAAQCFYGFVGFDAVATTGEEAKNPQRNIPLAIVISLIIIFLAYFGISTVLTMMWPYYDQDATAPLPYVYEKLGWTPIKWIVTIGAVIALCTSLLGAMFPLPRVIYAMANDGLIFKFLAKINPKTKTPIIATVLSGILVAIMAILFNTDQLINMMSIGTLLAYTIVAVCVLILRYEPVEGNSYPDLELKKEENYTFFGMFKQIFNLNMNKHATSTSTKITNWSIIIFAVFTAGFDAFIIYALDVFEKPYVLTLFVIVTIIMLILIVVIARQPTDEVKLSFKVPWVPFIPCLSIIINLYLMLELDKDTWIRFAVWLVIGFLIYFFYGLKNSEERKLRLDHKLKENATKTADKEVTKF